MTTEAHKCELPECPTMTTRPKFCTETHSRRNRQRVVALELPAERETEELRSALRRAQTSAAKAKAKTEDLVATVYQAARDAAVAQPPVRLLPIAKSGKGKPEVALLHTTDWQLGKLTDSYSMDICEERLNMLAAKVELLTDIQRTEHPVDEIVVLFGGDIIENINIFPGQVYEVEATLYEQMFRAVRLGKQLISRLLRKYKRVTVIAEEGNHGRLGRRGDFASTDNADMMVYEIIRQAFEDDSRVLWVPRKTWYQIVEVGAYRAMLIHGDEIKSFGGNTPAFGLLRKGTAWSSGVTDPFQDIYFGHFHTPMSLTLPNGGTMFGTGSTESGNAYAAEFVAARGKPSQRLHFIDPRKGRVTCEYKVFLDDEETTGKTQP